MHNAEKNISLQTLYVTDMIIKDSIQPTQTMSSLTVIDGSGFVYRAFHALPPLPTPDGTAVGAVVGFANMILRWQETHNPPMAWWFWIAEDRYCVKIFFQTTKPIARKHRQNYPLNFHVSKSSALP